MPFSTSASVTNSPAVVRSVFICSAVPCGAISFTACIPLPISIRSLLRPASISSPILTLPRYGPWSTVVFSLLRSLVSRSALATPVFHLLSIIMDSSSPWPRAFVLLPHRSAVSTLGPFGRWFIHLEVVSGKDREDVELVGAHRLRHEVSAKPRKCSRSRIARTVLYLVARLFSSSLCAGNGLIRREVRWRFGDA